MASFVLINRDGKKERDLVCSRMLPKGFILSEGCMLSWEEHFGRGARGVEEFAFSLGKARARGTMYSDGSGCVRVESLNAEDLFSLIDFVYSHLNIKMTKVASSSDPDIPSIVSIIKADLRRLKARIAGLWQRFSMWWTSIGSDDEVM